MDLLNDTGFRPPGISMFLLVTSVSLSGLICLPPERFYFILYVDKPREIPTLNVSPIIEKKKL